MQIVRKETICGPLEFLEDKLHLSITTVTTILGLGRMAKDLAQSYEKSNKEAGKRACYLLANQLWVIALLARKEEMNVRFYIYRVEKKLAFTSEESRLASAVIYCGGKSLTIPLRVLSTEALTHLLLHDDGVETRSASTMLIDIDQRDPQETERALLFAIGLINEVSDNWPINEVKRCLKHVPDVESFLWIH
jgi:hypothetical protein